MHQNLGEAFVETQIAGPRAQNIWFNTSGVGPENLLFEVLMGNADAPGPGTTL